MPELLHLRRCPTCRARLDQRGPEDGPCRRCGSDLDLLRGALALAGRRQRQARAALLRGDPAAAVAMALAALRLRDAPSIRQTLAAALVAAGRLEAARGVLREGGGGPPRAGADGASGRGRAVRGP